MPEINIRFLVSQVNGRELIRRGRPVINASVSSFGNRAMRQAGSAVRFNESNPEVIRFLRRWGVDRISNDVNRTTRDRLRTVLARGVEAGKSTAELAADIGHVFDVAKGSRALTIARTEVPRASNFASVQGFKQAGIAQKEWQATLDGSVRESHADMDGQIVDMHENFTSGDGNTAPYPGEFGIAEEDINCRCGVLAVVDSKGVRGWTWKALERERRPWQRRLRQAMVSGFEAQRRAVMAAFEEMAA